MTPEPLYEYVKGSGWIVRDNVVTMGCGTRVRLEFRKPVTGELATFNFVKRENFDWNEWAKSSCFSVVRTRREDVFPDYDWCVVVPVLEPVNE